MKLVIYISMLVGLIMESVFFVAVGQIKDISVRGE